MKLINQFSFVLVVVFLLVVFAFLTVRSGFNTTRLIYIGALVLLSLLAFFLLTPGTSSLNEVELIEARIGGGSPLLLEFQSLY